MRLPKTVLQLLPDDGVVAELPTTLPLLPPPAPIASYKVRFWAPSRGNAPADLVVGKGSKAARALSPSSGRRRRVVIRPRVTRVPPLPDSLKPALAYLSGSQSPVAAPPVPQPAAAPLDPPIRPPRSRGLVLLHRLRRESHNGLQAVFRAAAAAAAAGQGSAWLRCGFPASPRLRPVGGDLPPLLMSPVADPRRRHDPIPKPASPRRLAPLPAPPAPPAKETPSRSTPAAPSPPPVVDLLSPWAGERRRGG
eukprot:TRINITY_DN3893_c1_g1_i1.p1 TRINITY_DN3893_c1_g1~~TRINITY_DN3893_c1_g1_i1.p1  ORF type:complete len:251 (+),score=64.73 TRINITY_DN3893_c1_g1_i1:67-819(+)